MKHKPLYLLPFCALLSGLTGCATVDEREYPPDERAPDYEYRPVFTDYDYYFYPNVAVYLHIRTGYYFYEEHGRWVRVRQLPPHIRLDVRHRRHMIIRDPYPYIRYTEHARVYGGRDDDHDRDRDRDRRDDRGPDRDDRLMPPDRDRHERGLGRPGGEDRPYSPVARHPGPDERRGSPPPENRGREPGDRGVPGHGPDDGRRTPPGQGTMPGDDRPQGDDRFRSRDERPDARSPSREDMPRDKVRGEDGRGDAGGAGRLDRPEGSSRRDARQQDDRGAQGAKGRSPGGREDDDDELGHDRGAPGPR